MREFDRTERERIIRELEEKGYLFSRAKTIEGTDGLKLLGKGGFSFVYEMEDPEYLTRSNVMKVMGFGRHMVSSEDFDNAGRTQWILAQRSEHIVNVQAMRDLNVILAADGSVLEAREYEKESREEREKGLHLQFVLLEKLDQLLRLGADSRCILLRPQIQDEKEVLSFALQIGEALEQMHSSYILHRDIKLENIYWDESGRRYKLGDFDTVCNSGEQKQEIPVYTDGYGAPEARSASGNGSAEADIYSFGVCLFLLLNNFCFPSSEGYYPKGMLQYEEDYSFPAPAHASVELTRIIRKMCSYWPEDRYHCMEELLTDLLALGKESGSEISEKLEEELYTVTRSYREEKTESAVESPVSAPKKRKKGRVERIKLEKLKEENAKTFNTVFLLILVPLTGLLLKGMHEDTSCILSGVSWLIPFAVIFEAALLKRKEYHISFGVALAALIFYSMYSSGICFYHIWMLICILFGILCGAPLLLLIAGLGGVGWILIDLICDWKWVEALWTKDKAWLVAVPVYILVKVLLVVKNDKTEDKMEAYFRSLLIEVLMIVCGIVMAKVQNNLAVFPEWILRMHIGLVGAGSLIAHALLVLLIIGLNMILMRNDK